MLKIELLACFLLLLGATLGVSSLTALQVRIELLEARVRVQKIRVDEVECYLDNPFSRVSCE